MENNCIFPNLKIQLKARFRLPLYLETKKSYLNQQKIQNLLDLDNSEQKPIKKIKKKSNISNFHKYIIKTNSLKKVICKIPIKELFEKEKYCSSKCEDAIKEIGVYQNYLKFSKLPKIKKKNYSTKNIKIYKINDLSKSKEKHDNSEISLSKLRSRNVSASKIISSFTDNIRYKDNKNNSEIKNGKRNKFNGLINLNNNISIIKGGGIKYNNSIFRNKNMNNLIHFKSFQMII